MSLLSAQQGPPYSKKVTQQLLGSRRVAVIGNQGAGKTTLANTLAKMIGVDYVEVPWVNEMTQPEKEEIKRQMAQRENWIVDGDFGFLDMAETIIHLDFPLSLCLWRTTMRSIKRFLKWDFGTMNVLAAIPVRITQLLRLLSEVYWYPSEAVATPQPEPAAGSSKAVIVLKSPKELELFLSSIELPAQPCHLSAERKITPSAIVSTKN
jgi:energy-coupling factor transporter ATP-binding protein EcfA2